MSFNIVVLHKLMFKNDWNRVRNYWTTVKMENIC